MLSTGLNRGTVVKIMNRAKEHQHIRRRELQARKVKATYRIGPSLCAICDSEIQNKGIPGADTRSSIPTTIVAIDAGAVDTDVSATAMYHHASGKHLKYRRSKQSTGLVHRSEQSTLLKYSTKALRGADTSWILLIQSTIVAIDAGAVFMEQECCCDQPICGVT